MAPPTDRGALRGPDGGAPSERPEGLAASRHDAPGAPALGAPASDGPPSTPGPAVSLDAVSTWVERWRRDEASSHRVDVFPAGAAEVVEVVLNAVGSGMAPEVKLRVASARWAEAHRSVAELVERLGRLRHLLRQAAAQEPALVPGSVARVSDAIDRAVDLVLVAAVAAALSQVEQLSRTDPLTGVGNRRAFDEAARRAVTMVGRQADPVTMVVVDLDGLKHINDTQGHAAGDAALRSLVGAFGAALRGTDTVYRVGGDEFVLLLPGSGPDAAEALMARVKAAGAPRFTWGAASLASAADADRWFDQADRALYDRRRSLGRAVGATALAEAAAGPTDGGAVGIRRRPWVPAAGVAAAAALVVALLLGSTGSGRTTTSAGSPPPVRFGTGQSGTPSTPGANPTPPSTSPTLGAPAPAPSTAARAPVPASSGATPRVVVAVGVQTAATGPSSEPVAAPRPTPPPPASGPPAAPQPTPPPPAPSGSVPSGQATTGAGPLGALVADVGHLAAGVPVVDDLVTSGPGGTVDVAGLVQLGGGEAATATPAVAGS